MPIRSYLNDRSAFEPAEIGAMSWALEQNLQDPLQVDGQAHGREVIAARIADLARNGVIDAKVLSDRVVAEIKAMRSQEALGEHERIFSLRVAPLLDRAVERRGHRQHHQPF